MGAFRLQQHAGRYAGGKGVPIRGRDRLHGVVAVVWSSRFPDNLTRSFWSLESNGFASASTFATNYFFCKFLQLIDNDDC